MNEKLKSYLSRPHVPNKLESNPWKGGKVWIFDSFKPSFLFQVRKEFLLKSFQLINRHFYRFACSGKILQLTIASKEDEGNGRKLNVGKRINFSELKCKVKRKNCTPENDNEGSRQRDGNDN